MDWTALFRSKQFWLNYFCLAEEGVESSAGFQLRLPVSPEQALLLEKKEHDRKVSLFLEGPDLPQPLLLAYDDDWPNDFKPYLLRWGELQDLCNCLGQRDATLRHPIPFVLLYRFTPITAVDPITAGREIARALADLGCLSTEEASEIWEVTVYDGCNCWWVWNEQRGAWVLAGEALSLRTADNEAYPFALFEMLLNEAARCAAGA